MASRGFPIIGLWGGWRWGRHRLTVESRVNPGSSVNFPFIVAEFVAHDSKLRFRSLSHVSGSVSNPPRPLALPLML